MHSPISTTVFFIMCLFHFGTCVPPVEPLIPGIPVDIQGHYLYPGEATTTEMDLTETEVTKFPGLKVTHTKKVGFSGYLTSMSGPGCSRCLQIAPIGERAIFFFATACKSGTSDPCGRIAEFEDEGSIWLRKPLTSSSRTNHDHRPEPTIGKGHPVALVRRC